jgi:transposase
VALIRFERRPKWSTSGLTGRRGARPGARSTLRGEVVGEGVVPADVDGVLRLVATAGREVTAAVEMMSGAAWVAETLEAAGWRVQLADSRRARALAPLAARTDKIDARALAELARRDLDDPVGVRVRYCLSLKSCSGSI